MSLSAGSTSLLGEEGWRRGWDSNPRYGLTHTRFPSVLLKPLGHLSRCILFKPSMSPQHDIVTIVTPVHFHRKSCHFQCPLWVLEVSAANLRHFSKCGGEGGIRTHGTGKGTPVFETGPIDHSGTSPRSRLDLIPEGSCVPGRMLAADLPIRFQEHHRSRPHHD